jgi:hypothetical protein
VSAPQRSLPARPSLEQQKKLAKDLLAAHHGGDAEAVDRVREHLPGQDRIALSHAQFVIAREYGFRNWAALKKHIEDVDRTLPESIHEDFKRAFDAGDAHAIRHLFERHPGARRMIDAPIFSFDSPALVHFAGAGHLVMVQLLLDQGADPNRRSEWWAGGFHALHVATGAVADRLIEAGAVADACAASNLDDVDLLRRLVVEDPSRVHERGGDGKMPLHFARSRAVVDLLLEKGADLDARDIDHCSTAAQWMLDQKREAGRYELARYLVERGAEVDVFLAAALGLVEPLREMLESDATLIERRTGQGDYASKPPGGHIYTWTIGQNLSPLQVAAQFEQVEALDILRMFASPKDRFIAACAQARETEARDLLRQWPGLIGQLGPDDRRVLPDAAWAGNAAAVDLMLSIGFDETAGGQDGGTVLHCAAWQGAVDCMDAALRHTPVRELIETRDPVHNSSPLGWCCHGARYCSNPEGDYPAVARLLLEAGAKPGPNLNDAPADVLAVIRAHSSQSG